MPPFNAARRRFAQGAVTLGTLPWLIACGSDDATAAERAYADAVQRMMSTRSLPGVLAGDEHQARTVPVGTQHVVQAGVESLHALRLPGHAERLPPRKFSRTALLIGLDAAGDR